MFYNFEWRITGQGEIDSDSVRFNHIGKDILYLPIYYVNEMRTPAGNPFYIDINGMHHILDSSSADSLISFNSISSENFISFSGRMIDGIFESSANVDLNETKIVHTITDFSMLYNEVKLKHPHTCRYIRYKSPIEGWCPQIRCRYL